MSTSRLKVTIIGINYAPEVAGIAPYTTGLAERLVRDGYEVRVVTSMPHYPAWRILPEHVDLPNVDTVSGVGCISVVIFRSGMLGRLRMELGFTFRAVTSRWGQPDVVICVSPSLVSSAAALLKARISRKRPKTIAWVQDIYSKGVVEAVDGGLVARATVVGESAILRLARPPSLNSDRFKLTDGPIWVCLGRVEGGLWLRFYVSAPSKVPDTDQRCASDGPRTRRSSCMPATWEPSRAWTTLSKLRGSRTRPLHLCDSFCSGQISDAGWKRWVQESPACSSWIPSTTKTLRSAQRSGCPAAERKA